MATSDTTKFNLDIDDIINEAYERCGLESRSGYDLKTAKRSMNLLLADWANRGLNQWTIKQSSITVAADITEYPGGTLTMTVGDSSSFSVPETITGGTSAATASITNLPSATSMAITIPTGTFTSGETLTGGTSAATTTLSAAVDLTDAQATIDILSLVVKRGDNSYAAARLSRDGYITIPNKTETGRPSQFFLDRQITPNLKIWPAPENSTDTLIFDRLYRIDDGDDFTNTLGVPFRFYPALAAGLAYYIALKRAPDRIQILKPLYEEEMERAMTEDRDRASFNVVPSLEYARFN